MENIKIYSVVGQINAKLYAPVFLLSNPSFVDFFALFFFLKKRTNEIINERIII
jgi:hypothetical protein